jgi:hypothetical protein
MVTVTLSTPAIDTFQRDELTADDLARHAAEWALLTQRRGAHVDFTRNDLVSAFRRYFFQEQATARQSC